MRNSGCDGNAHASLNAEPFAEAKRKYGEADAWLTDPEFEQCFTGSNAQIRWVSALSSVIFGGLIIMIAIQLSNMFMLTGYDFWTDYTASRRRINLAKNEEGIEFIELIQNITPKLVALK